MMQVILLAVSTLCFAIILIAVLRSGSYEPLIEPLSEEDHPLKELYSIGLLLSKTPLFALRGKLERDLKRQSRLYWDNAYYEYYAYITWAQFLTYAVLIVGFGCVLAALSPNPLPGLVLGFVALGIAAAWDQTVSKAKDAVNERREECEYEFPTMVSKLALLVSSGMITRQAWSMIANGKTGTLYDLMKRSCDEMENGASETEAIHHFGVLTDSNVVKKFTSTLIQSLEKGSADLPGYLLDQTTELWERKKQMALQRGEVAAGKLVLPIGFMFGGIILIIVVAALQSISL